MRKEAAFKFPQSAELFQFCREVLDYKSPGSRVIDQDIGQILNLDPADCSHWKNGKKHIKSVKDVKKISKFLKIDENLISNIAHGEICRSEAFFEYAGYGDFSIDSKRSDTAKKAFYKKNPSHWNEKTTFIFNNYFESTEKQIKRIVGEIHENISFKEAPLYLPELLSYYPDITVDSKPTTNLSPKNSSDYKFGPVEVNTNESNKLEIYYNKDLEMRPYVRFAVAQAVSLYFLPKKETFTTLSKDYSDYLSSVERNIFAANLLAPSHLIEKELRYLNCESNLVTQLSEVFWVSPRFMNQRLYNMLTQEK